MRLSGWRKTAPAAESMSADVLAMLKPVLADLGAEADPTCWVVWGDDPEVRYSILVPTIAGLIVAAVRTANQGGTPRTTAKLVRWPKLSVSELNLEASSGHRIVAVQVETLVIKGVDEEADRICEFVRGLIAEVDDRHPQQAPIAYVQTAAVQGVAVAAQPADEHVAGPVAVPVSSPVAVPDAGPVASPEESPVAAAAAQAAIPPAPVATPSAMASVKEAPKRAAAPKSVAAPVAATPPAAPPAAASSVAASPEAVVPAASTAPGRRTRAASTATPKAPARAAKPVSAPPAIPGTGLSVVPAPVAAATAAASRTPALKPRLSREKPQPVPEPEPELDRSNWIAPHPIAAAAPHKPVKPRPWRP